MSLLGMALIKEHVDMIIATISNDAFTIEELETIKKSGEVLASSTQKVIGRANVQKENGNG